MRKALKIFLATLAVINLTGTAIYFSAESAPARNNIRSPGQNVRQNYSRQTYPEPEPEVTSFDDMLTGEKVTYKVGYMPEIGFLYQDIPGHNTGYGYEYMEFLANYMNCKFKYVPVVSWEEMSEKLQSGEIDMAPNIPGDWRKLENSRRTDHVVGYIFAELVTDKKIDGEHLKLGTLSMNYPTPSLPGIAKGENFTYELVTYENYKDMTADFYSGEIDGYIDMMTNPNEASKVVALFDRQSYRISVRSDRRELLARLNLAMDAMLLSQSDIRERLSRKYLRNKGFPLVLGLHEREYLKKKDVLRAGIFTMIKPYAYRDEEGNLVGVYPDIIKKISIDLNTKIEIVETKTVEELHDLLKRGEIDFVADAICDYGQTGTFAKPTRSYLKYDYVPVTRPDYFEDPSSAPIVACVPDWFVTKTFIEPKYPRLKRVYVSSLEEGIRAVNSGMADIVYIPRAAAQILLENTESYALEISSNSPYSDAISLGVEENADPFLWHILNKEINHIAPDFINSAFVRHQKISSRITPKWIVYHYPGRVIVGVMIFLAILGGALYYRSRMRKKHFQMVQHMAYSDLRYNLPNVPKMEHDAPIVLEDLESREPGSLAYIVVFAMESQTAVIENS